MIRRIKLSYGRELKARTVSLSGWLFIALNTLSLLLCTSLFNIRVGYAAPEYALEMSSLILCATAPLLASFSSASEIKRGELELLLRYTDAKSLVIGKYLAHLTLFAPTVLIAAVIPPILSLFGNVYLPSAYSGVIGYALFGAAIIALCLYISCATGRPAICFSVGAVSVFSLNILSNVARTVSAPSAFVTVAIILITLITLALFFYLDSFIPAAVFAVCSTALTLTLSFNGALTETVMTVIRFLSPQYSLSLFIYGAPELGGVLQPICFTLIFLALCVLRTSPSARR